MKHQLKILPEHFDAVYEEQKTFEIRKNDREFNTGDLLILREWDPDKEEYTGSFEIRKICYMTDYEQKEDYVVLGMRKVTGISDYESSEA